MLRCVSVTAFLTGRFLSVLRQFGNAGHMEPAEALLPFQLSGPTAKPVKLFPENWSRCDKSPRGRWRLEALKM